MTNATTPRDPGRRDLVWMLGLGAALLAFFLIPFLAGGTGFPVGPDGPVYVWWMRLAAHDGLSSVERPGVPALSLVLAGTLHLSEAAVTAAVEVVLGAATGLAAWALVRGHHRPGHPADAGRGASREAAPLVAPLASPLVALLAGVFAGLFAAHLANGYLANLAFSVAFLAAATTLGTDTSAGAVTAALVLAAGGLAHPQFFLVGVVVLVFTALLTWRAGEGPGAARIALAGVGAGAFLGLGLLFMHAGTEVLRVDTSRDGFLRRAGMMETVRSLYRERFLQRAPRYVHWATVPLGAYALPDAVGFLGRFLIAWAIVTVAGVLFGFATAWLPPDRFVAFGTVIPLLAAFGLVKLWRRLAARRPLAVVVCGALGAAMAAGALIPWLRAEPFITAEQVRQVQAVRYADVPPGTPLVFDVERRGASITFFATQAANVIRAAVPPERIPDVFVRIPPTPGYPGPERLALSRLYDADIRRAAAARGLPAAELALPAFGSQPTPGEAETPAPGFPLLRPPSPGGILLACSGVLALLVLAGLGWARAIFRDRSGGPALALALAPAFGMAGLILLGTALERAGLPLTGTAGPAIVSALVTGGGHLVSFVLRRRGLSGAPAES